MREYSPLDHPAFAVMTDLREVPAATPSAGESVDRDGAIEGVITATDILGEKPLRLTQVATLKQARRQHVMVYEDGGRVVRGEAALART